MCIKQEIEIIYNSNISPSIDALNQLLIECVDNDASIGFLPPVNSSTATQYWQQIEASILCDERILITAVRNKTLIGCVQLSLMNKPNARHRAEVEKLMVSKNARKQGVGEMLMLALEKKAREYQRSLLVLDTREGDAASILYRKLNYIEAGKIPNFALNSSGETDPTVFFYKNIN